MLSGFGGARWRSNERGKGGISQIGTKTPPRQKQHTIRRE
ncbi:hypothetical protein DYY67_0940 [Candidatus Nitrosotalea sp. TS]|nr:hypothetical protein [Candidatus Nitrosotalea sp. TS]